MLIFVFPRAYEKSLSLRFPHGQPNSGSRVRLDKINLHPPWTHTCPNQSYISKNQATTLTTNSSTSLKHTPTQEEEGGLIWPACWKGRITQQMNINVTKPRTTSQPIFSVAWFEYIFGRGASIPGKRQFGVPVRLETKEGFVIGFFWSNVQEDASNLFINKYIFERAYHQCKAQTLSYLTS
jgi:hypothetical protein